MALPYVGEIKLVPYNFAPLGWLFCHGQILPISEFETLFQLIGTTYGGDGQSTFALPDLRGRVSQGYSQSWPIGAVAGSEQVTLNSIHLPPHTHALAVGSAPGTSPDPTGRFLSESSVAAQKPFAPPSTPPVQMGAAAVAATGGGQPHENMQPFLVLNFVIAYEGVYPQPS